MKTGTRLTSSDRFTHYCALCTCVLDADVTHCPGCGSEPPPQGWPELDTSPYPYLGKLLDDRYLLNQFLGDGATGYVYRAQAVQIQRDFAAKIVDTRRYGKPEFEQELLRRFRLEVEAMSRLRNPHVVAIYEAMQLQDSIFCLLMDFVDGRTLQELLDRVGRIKLGRALDLARQIANGLYEAHSVGFIHRDLKPDNVMIERLPASGFFARILDFGIVHMMDSVTSTQGFRGTPLYASPEQCVGDPGIDHRADIYSLGCVVFHCITGQPPFPGTESLKVMDAHVTRDPPRIGDVLEGTAVPERLETLVASMLAKDPDDRPADLSVVIRALDDLMRAGSESISERTRPEEPGGSLAGETETLKFELDRRIETADFPAASLGEASSSGSTHLVRSLVEFNLPADLSDDAAAFSASALTYRGDVAGVADRLNRVHCIGLKNDGYFQTFEGARGIVTALFVDRDRGVVFASEMDGTILRWPLDEPGAPDKIAKLDDRIYAMSSDRTGTSVVCGTERGRVVSVDVASGQQTVIVDGGPPISALAKSHTENKLLVGFWGGKLEVVDTTTRRVQELDPLPANPISMVVSEDGYIAAVLDEKQHIRILSLVHGTGFFEIRAEETRLRSLAFADDSQLLGMGVDKTTLRLWDIKNRPAMKALN